jgi:murein L,D-transpeptidase YcbB/YkuD
MPKLQRFSLRTTLMLTLTPALLSLLPVTVQAQSDRADMLRSRLEHGAQGAELIAGGVHLYTGQMMLDIYANTDFELAWTRDEQLDGLNRIAAQLEREGLNPDDLPLRALAEARISVRQDDSDAALITQDLLATETLLRAAYQLKFGKVNPATHDNDWNFSRALIPGQTPTSFFVAATSAEDIAAFIVERYPRNMFYKSTVDALAHYRGIAAAGGWPAVSTGETIHPGDSDPRVIDLRHRLRVTGQLAPEDDNGSADFDETLTEAVKRFQEQHELDIDGVVGKASIEAMNVPVALRVTQLRLALERMRWVHDDLRPDMLVVNIAGFRLSLFRNDQVSWRTRVMVGKPYRKTPIFRGDIEYLVFNPTWTVPPGILAKDKLPTLKKEGPGYLQRTNMAVLTHDGVEVDPNTIDWQSATARNFPYMLRQKPGPNNALGQVKFIFPNPHFVFLHDTPSKALFDRSERAFSSGCIRVEHPLELARLLLNDQDKWDSAAIDATIAGAETKTVHLKDTFPVLIMYLTALGEPGGPTYFYRDIYDRDTDLLEALDSEIVIDLPDWD